MVYFQIDSKNRKTNPDEMEIKYELVLNGMDWAPAEDIEYNTIGEFQTNDIKIPGYYIAL